MLDPGEGNAGGEGGTQLELLKLQAAVGRGIQGARRTAAARPGTRQCEQAEAASDNPFASSRRSLCGYVCVLGLAYQFLIQSLLAWAPGIWSVPPPPDLDRGICSHCSAEYLDSEVCAPPRSLEVWHALDLSEDDLDSPTLAADDTISLHA